METKRRVEGYRLANLEPQCSEPLNLFDFQNIKVFTLGQMWVSLMGPAQRPQVLRGVW
jgi:hypothetical protein